MNFRSFLAAAFISSAPLLSARADITTSLVLPLNLDETSGTTAGDSSGAGNPGTRTSHK